MTNKNATCEVTVTVSGDRNAGKSTLIAVLSQALLGAGHGVNIPKDTPSAISAIADLSRPYLVTFVEDYGQEGAPTGDLEAATAKIARLEERVNEFRDKNIELVQEVQTLTVDRDAAQARVPDSAVVAAAINKALLYARESAVIDRDRQELTRQTEDLKSRASKMRHEADARMKEAELSLRAAFSGTFSVDRVSTAQQQVARRAATVQQERIAAARHLSPEDKLALANGAEPRGAHEAIVAAALDENAQTVAEAMYEDAGVGYREAVEAMAQTRAHDAASPLDVGFPGEASLASLIERSLSGHGG